MIDMLHKIHQRLRTWYHRKFDGPGYCLHNALLAAGVDFNISDIPEWPTIDHTVPRVCRELGLEWHVGPAEIEIDGDETVVVIVQSGSRTCHAAHCRGADAASVVGQSRVVGVIKIG
jgi:hypothetical protein